MEIIPYGRQYIDKADISELTKVLRSDWITQGPKVDEFEQELAGYCGAKYAVAVSSGTAALHLACLVAGLEKGDEAVTTPITFLATSNSVLYTGAKPVFADVDYKTANIDPRQIIRKITRKTRAILPVHLAGLACDMESIYAIAKKHGLLVIEDACHALGATYKYRGKWVKVGGCRHSDMAAFSFHPVKPITTGEGGAITTNNERFYNRLLALRSHGVYRDKTTAQKGPWYYDMRELGFNYRITAFQCALGISQLKRIDRFLQKRRRIAKRYNKAFEDIQEAVILPSVSSEDRGPAWHLYILRLRLDRLKADRKKIFMELLKKNIRPQIHYIPLYWHSFYKGIGYGREHLINAERYYSECISLPIYYGLTYSQQDYVIKCVKTIIKKYIE